MHKSLLPLALAGSLAAAEPLTFKDPTPQRYELTARASGIDPRAKAHPEIDFVFEKGGKPVDVENATWTNTIGAPELIAVWKDPEFDAKQSAFYYGRVIEIPTPRWTAYDAKRFGVKMPKEVPMTTTERAYTSPIWYTP